MTIGEQIRQLRTEAGLSVNALSEMSGVNKYTIYHIEKGQNSGQYETIRLILKAMGYELYAIRFKEREDESETV